VEGEKTISLHLDDLEVRKALEILSREGPFNILVSPGVSGRVTASLQNVTPNQALDAVLQLANLIARREGNLIYVYVPEELRAGLGPDQWICTRIYHLNYIRSTDLDWSSS
jgi:type II secretory pathway component HofQ